MNLSIKRKIKRKLLLWYQLNAREFPWRGLKDPYLIWISEVMLQQTQAEAVIPYFQHWINRFPKVQSVACASEDDILKMWEGLGYYSRARNIKKAAVIICNQLEGVIPDTVSELKNLPGVGNYIAGAIASMAYGVNEPALDSNGIRVISRLFDFHGMVSKMGNKRILEEYLRDLISNGSAGDFNQAVMDLGSMICVPVNPSCIKCPIKKECLAFSRNTQAELPVVKKRAPKLHFDVVAAIIKKDNKVLIDKRPADGLLGGMWEFPGGKIESKEDHPEALRRELREELGIQVNLKDSFGAYNHACTHFTVTVYTYFVEIVSGNPKALEAEKIRWAEINALQDFPMGKVDRNISDDLEKRMNNRSFDFV
ncbi:MAG: A/G-specific adenine glycosylase [Anaerolineaceae bacterium]|nr:A/G-specific adenine glycosylase [Anaerolineaceae bacterium]